MAIDGNWEVTMNSPMGEQKATLTLNTDGDKLSGKMASSMGTEEFTDGKVDGNNLEWSLDISKPMPMTLKFNATVDGDDISGKVSLGMFGSSDMSGHRAS